MPNSLTLTSATFDSSAQKFGTGAISAGNGVGPATMVTAIPYTIECQAKRSSVPSAKEYIMGQGGSLNVGMTSAGFIEFQSGKSTVVTITGATNCADNAWHHIAVTFATASTWYCYVDGVRVGSSAPGTGLDFRLSSGCATMGIMGVGVTGGIQSGTQFGGEIDEAVVWNTAKYTTSTITVPTAPYTATTGMLALWHLDGDGSDTSASYLLIAPNNAAITYSPYNWLVGSGSAKTINSGAYFNTAFTGSACTLQFDTSALLGSYFPQIWYRIDRSSWVLARVAATVPLTMPSNTAGWPRHTLEVLCKANSEFQLRWATQGTAFVMTGIQVDTTSVLSAIISRTKNILIFGDSITEGFQVMNGALRTSATDDVQGSDSLACWSYMQKDLLGVELGVVGEAGIGLASTAVGQGAVPGLMGSYNLLWAGQARTFTPVPDLIVINIGQNDSAVTQATYTANYTAFLNSLLTACPNAPIAAMRPFSGFQAAAIQAACLACSNPSLVTYIDTTALYVYYNTGLSVDNIHPQGIESWLRLSEQFPANAKWFSAGSLFIGDAALGV